MALDKGDGRLERLLGLGTVLDHQLMSLAFYGQVLVHLHIRRSPQHQSHDKSDTHLAHYLVAALEPLFVATEDFDKIVHSPEKAEPHGGYNHQYEIDIAQSAKQQDGYEDRHDDDGGHAYLLDTKGVYRGISLSLGNLFFLQVLNEFLAKPG